MFASLKGSKFKVGSQVPRAWAILSPQCSHPASLAAYTVLCWVSVQEWPLSLTLQGLGAEPVCRAIAPRSLGRLACLTEGEASAHAANKGFWIKKICLKTAHTPAPGYFKYL